MLVTFSCPAYPNITMFGDVAIRLIKMTGHSGTVPSAIPAEEVPAAHEHHNSTNNDGEEPDISRQRRALPVLELLEAVEAAKCYVMWDRG